MKTELFGDEGKVGELARLHPGGSGVGWGNPSSGCRRFSVFWEEGLDLVCGEAAVGDLLQVVGEIMSDVGPARLALASTDMMAATRARMFWVHNCIQSLRPKAIGPVPS